MNQKYADAIMALSELLLDVSRDSRLKDYEIERLKEKITNLEMETKSQ